MVSLPLSFVQRLILFRFKFMLAYHDLMKRPRQKNILQANLMHDSTQQSQVADILKGCYSEDGRQVYPGKHGPLFSSFSV